MFKDSMTDYEKGLRAEFGKGVVTLEALNWLRWVRDVKCGGDEVERRREYPSRPEEAFQAHADAVLDPVTIAAWEEEARKKEPWVIDFLLTEDKYGEVTIKPEPHAAGRVEVYAPPKDGKAYVMGVDPAQGTEKGDWIVACVLEVETGTQVAEFRSRCEPDIGIDQIEALGIYYNQAYTGVEANTYGMPYARALEDRGTLPLFEREIPDRREPNKTNKFLGWLTTAKTREMLLTEVRRNFRERECRVCSLETLSEARTLTVRISENRVERIEARPGAHDDGIFAFGIACLMRNRVLPGEIMAVREEDTQEEPSDFVASFLEGLKEDGKALPFRNRTKHAKGGRVLIGGRRSVF